jgi:D-sedoheptulose 7-phosphate isomerase
MPDFDGAATSPAGVHHGMWPSSAAAKLEPDAELAVGAALQARLESHLEGIRRIAECQQSLLKAGTLISRSLASGHTLFTLGNGGSAAEAQHFAAELVGRFRLDRSAYPAMALTTDSSILTAVGNDFGFADVFARQVEAFMRPGDVLVAFSTSGESENAIRAASAARLKGGSVIAMTGDRDSSLARAADVVVQAPSNDTATIQELHSMFTHVLCEVVESALACREGGIPA